MEFDKPEGLREMLQLDLEMERADVGRYLAHAELADELGDFEIFEIKVKLEEIAEDEGHHARLLERLVRGLP